MQYYDVFNGDADGICALHQLRMAEPRQSILITGVKRDIKLLDKIKNVNEAVITVFDVSLDTNRSALEKLLNQGCKVTYIDHHFAGEIPRSANLETHIDADPEICTSLIVDILLKGRFRAWAVAAAFGDNQHASAKKAAASLSLTEKEVGSLRELGELLNYNGYGATVEDLHIAPDKLYKALHPYEDPLIFFNESSVLGRLRSGYKDDMDKGMQFAPVKQSKAGRIFRFPHEPWARRVAGVFINQRARERADLAHALLIDLGNGAYMVSVRAPFNRKQGADELCRMFPTGGGRAAGAGINSLPGEKIDTFFDNFDRIFSI